MTIVAEEYRHVMGVDTNATTHTYAIVETSTGVCKGTESFPTRQLPAHQSVEAVPVRGASPAERDSR